MNKQEEWKPVVGYETIYEVSNLGRIRSIDRIDANGHHRASRLKTQHIAMNGYYRVTLFDPIRRKIKTHEVHSLVAKAFLPNPNNLPQVNHIDEDKSHNCLDNLEYVSAATNNAYGTRKKRQAETYKRLPPEKKNHWSRQCIMCTSEKIIREYDSVREAARDNGLDGSSISKCCRGKLKTCGGYVWRYK